MAVSRLHRDVTRIGPEQLRHTLEALVREPPAMMMVHSSLSSCGRFNAGPDDILAALGDACGLLCLPTHTYCYPHAAEAGPVYDPTSTPSQNGRLTEIFRSRPEVVRSLHATHSIAARGPEADMLIAGHYLADSPCGFGTPYSRLVHSKAAALMFGVSFQTYTFFHTAEFEAESEHAAQLGVTDRLRVIDEAGEIRETQSRRQNWAPMRFKEAGDLLERKGLVRRIRLGRSHLLYVPDVTRAHDFIVERLRRYPDFLRHSSSVDLH
jgi:aminoglycoside 3-N-acetyltransferase